MHRLVLASVALVCSAVVIGCGGPAENPNRPATAAVTGTVTYKGQPVEGATVAFLPEVPSGTGASGRTDASGKFSLTAFDPNDGAVPGRYLVTVTKTAVEGSGEVQEDPNAPPVTHKSLLPEKYGKPMDSGLTAEVKEGVDNQFTFELTD
ncbi:MAG: carboxypeptidase-like regulatory domain-containing protein [Thermoguttaceae bacterium]